MTTQSNYPNPENYDVRFYVERIKKLKDLRDNFLRKRANPTKILKHHPSENINTLLVTFKNIGSGLKYVIEGINKADDIPLQDIPKELIELWSCVSAIRLLWTFKKKNFPLIGSINILHEGAMLASPKGKVVTGQMAEDPLLYMQGDYDLRKARMFDIFDEERGQTIIYFHGNGKYELLYYRAGEELYPLNLSIKEYMDALTRTKGFWHWQKFVAEYGTQWDKFFPLYVAGTPEYEKIESAGFAEVLKNILNY